MSVPAGSWGVYNLHGRWPGPYVESKGRRCWNRTMGYDAFIR